VTWDPGKSIPFVKASALGNDFLLIDAKFAPADMATFTRAICDRNNGVGADGVEWLYESGDRMKADLKIRLINADGSPAEISGNGTRCVASWVVAERGISSPRIATDAGVKLCEMTRREGNYFEFKTNMGRPEIKKEIVLDIDGESVKGLELSMGNPQFVTFVNRFETGWQVMAHDVSHHRHFPQGTNVELARVKDEHEIEIRIFERGAGETLSSGTGSSAAAVAAIAAGKAQSPVQVVAPGGTQTVRWENDEVVLYGSARLLCRGEFFL
jgi:diaminopimelate epimerase